jgi:hypothetical protein
MKTQKKYLLFLLLGLVSFTFSCKKDDTTTPDNNPTITATADKSSVKAGDVVTFSITANSGASGSKLKTLTFEESIPGTSSFTKIRPDSTLVGSPTNFGYNFKYTVPASSEDKTIRFTITDADNATGSVSKTLSYGSNASLKECSNVNLGNQNSTGGSSFSTSDCGIFIANDAKNNSAKIDFIHYNGDKNGPTIAAPDDADLQGSFDNKFHTTTWGTINGTRFKKLSGFNFDNATSASIKDAYNSTTGDGDSYAKTLGINYIIGFKKANGQYGVFRVEKITGTNTTAGAITLTVKTQQ